MLDTTLLSADNRRAYLVQPLAVTVEGRPGLLLYGTAADTYGVHLEGEDRVDEWHRSQIGFVVAEVAS